MGLDNIWHIPEGTSPPTLKVNLVGGMFSGPGESTCTSFRGKVYVDFIEIISGYSLYEEVLDKDDISAILDYLVGFKEEFNKVSKGYARVAFLKDRFGGMFREDNLEFALQHLDDLIAMFEAYSNIEGAELRSWY